MSELIQLSRGMYEPGHPFHTLKVMPPDVQRPPMYLLGSSGASATSAGRAGLGYAFASHFSATDPAPAIAAYRENFQPGEGFEKPHAILGLAAVAADTDEDAQRLASTMELAWLRIEQGEFLPLPSPEEADAYRFTAGERASIERRRRLTVTGDAKTVRAEIERRVAAAGADEAMVVTNIWSHEARLRSYELLAS
jgi:luciferase family oxidoreductase group 1